MRINETAAKVVALLRDKRLTLATAESCTGGGVGHAVTAVPGSSSVYLGGVISYSNEIKMRVLGVSDEDLNSFGAVSSQTASAMAEGVQRLIGSDISVSITGIAGPASDDTNKPVGLVYVAVRAFDKTVVKENLFKGDRDEVRQQSILKALEMILENL